MRLTFNAPLVQNTTPENNSFSLGVRIWNNDADAWSAVAGTTARYRVDCLTTGNTMLGWTSTTAASEMTLPMTSAINAIVNPYNRTESRQVTVEINHGLSSQTLDTFTYSVNNNGAI